MDKTGVLDPRIKEDEQEFTVRPSKLDDFLGQMKLKENLKVFIQASISRQETLDHILFYGPPGLGKTTLAQIIAIEMGAKIKFTSGPVLTKSGDLAALLTNLEEGDILFIDEIHRLPIAVEEILYSAMEDFKIDFMVGEGTTARSLRLDLPKFTLVGATTRYGLLSNPLRDRFGITLQLNFYSANELQMILKRTASLFNIQITDDGAFEIAKRSRGTPRIANRLLKRVRDFLEVSTKNQVDTNLANNALLKMGIDADGLDDLDRKYLESMAKFYDGGPVGIDTMATILAESRDTIEDTVEPYLIQNGFIARTPRGRILGHLGWKFLKLEAKKKE
jgi:Holliday junction DNA helicase RuvB